MMKRETILRIIKLGFLNFWRNQWLSLAATLIMTITLMIVSIFSILTLVINSTTAAIKERIDLTVTFHDSAPESAIGDLRAKLAARPETILVNYISKDEAYENWLKLQTSDKIKGLVTREDNPLPRSLQVKAKDPENLAGIADFIARPEYQTLVRQISYQKNKPIIDKLISITTFVKKVGFNLSLIFVLISILVIFNTIKLAIFTRRDEIEIMRLVGASDAFVRLPFILEGALYGLLATIFSFAIVGIGVQLVAPVVTRYLGEVNLDLAGFFTTNMLQIFLLQLGVGLVIGVGCSLIVLQRFMRRWI